MKTVDSHAMVSAFATQHTARHLCTPALSRS
jgi:hypothetical protein